jgi:PhnB protein
MAQIIPYLNFKGNCEEVFNFYKATLGGDFPYIGRYKDMPPSDDPNKSVSTEFDEKIMHMSLVMPDGTTLMGSDICGPWGDSTVVGNNIQLSINASSEENAHEIFNGLSAGGNVVMPLGKTFWGAFFGMFADKYGINWMVNYDYPQEK